MIVLLAALAGAIIGGLTAARRKGNKLDILQYATIYCIAFSLVGLIVTIIIHRIALG
ncbi:apolipoprotein acyltransferase [Sagittula sp. NFXS13]|uniref:Apolipoprotein acyltransferase n=1 Tax=Sagittula marina TaxID=943940 RepID=A0A7W6GR64_9RHOB|nr:apolipoprotein acyltransferase [Sagittula marina]MBB3985081.1 hypothetical protein [Sagittula marina]